MTCASTTVPVYTSSTICSRRGVKLESLIIRSINNYAFIKELELLKQSLISEVVTGKIDVRNIDIPEYEKVTIIEDEIEEFDEVGGEEDGN